MKKNRIAETTSLLQQAVCFGDATYTERKYADAIVTVPVPWAGDFHC